MGFDPTVFGQPGLIWEWYRWGAFVALALALVAIFWVFFDSQRRGRESILWKVVGVVSLILTIPSVILRFDPSLALNIVEAVEPLAYLGMAAGVAAIVTILSYSAGVGVQELPPELVMADYYEPVREQAPSSRPTPQPPPPLEPTLVPASHGYQEPASHGRVSGPAKTEVLRKEPAHLAWLIQHSGLRAGKEFRLGEVTNVGRDTTQSDVVVDESSVSRQHARVRLESGQWVLYDLASTNGTFVNGEQIQKQALLDGDAVRFGEAEFWFMEVKQTP